MSHTPGPWKWSEDGAMLVAPSQVLLCPGNVPGGIDIRDGWAALLGAYSGSNEQSESDARLIEAAPNLLDDLIEAAKLLRKYEELHRAKGTKESTLKAEVNAGWATRFENTIAKARGGK